MQHQRILIQVITYIINEIIQFVFAGLDGWRYGTLKFVFKCVNVNMYRLLVINIKCSNIFFFSIPTPFLPKYNIK